jgi:hypothetical protein
MLFAPRENAQAIRATARHQSFNGAQHDVERLNDLARRQPEAVVGVLQFWLSKASQPTHVSR